METRFNKNPNRRRHRLHLRGDWQEKLPLRGLAVCLVLVAAVVLLLLINEQPYGYVSSADLDILRAKDILRVGVDTDVYGLSNNGEGLEWEITRALSEAVFGEPDACEAVETTRQNVQWYFTDGLIDLAVMSLPSLPASAGYGATELPFYVDEVVLMSYGRLDDLSGKTAAVLYNTAAESVLEKYCKEHGDGAPAAVSYAAYYDMLVALRAGTVDAVCMTRTAALSHKTSGMVINKARIGTVEYHILAKNSETVLLKAADGLLSRWIEDGSLRAWYEKYGLTY